MSAYFEDAPYSTVTAFEIFEIIMRNRRFDIQHIYKISHKFEKRLSFLSFVTVWSLRECVAAFSRRIFFCVCVPPLSCLSQTRVVGDVSSRLRRRQYRRYKNRNMHSAAANTGRIE